jgi:large subunit ribosomal protein L25
LPRPGNNTPIMAHKIQIKATRRNESGSAASRQLRRDGRIPAILYGGSGGPQSLEIPATLLVDALNQASSENVLVDLEIEGEGGGTLLAIIQDVQHHPLRDTVLHLDLHEIRADQKIQTHVPLHETGEPDGVRNSGGVMDHVMRSLHVECLPADLPGEITVDVSHLVLNQALHVGDIALPKGVTALHPAEQVVFRVHEPRIIAEPEPAAAAAPAAEPEVITEKKKDEKAEPAAESK